MTIFAIPRLAIQKAGSLIGRRRTLNFIEGSNVTLTVQDDSGNNRVNCTIASSGGGGGGGLAIPVLETGRVYIPPTLFSPTNSNGYVNIDNVHCVPIWLPAGNIDAVEIYVSSAEASDSVVVGIYDSTGGLPNTVLAEGTASVASTGLKTVTFTSTAISAGLHYLAFQTNAALAGFRRTTAANCAGLLGAADVSTNPAATLEYNSTYTGNLPTLSGGTPNTYWDYLFQLGVRGA